MGAPRRSGYSKPTWSPDGSLILLTHGDNPGPSKLGLAVVRPDGSGLRWVADGTGFNTSRTGRRPPLIR